MPNAAAEIDSGAPRLPEVLSFLRRHWLTLLLGALAGGLGLLLVSLRTTPLYQAYVSVNIELPSEQNPLGWGSERERSAQAWWNYYQTEYEKIRSRQVGAEARLKLGLPPLPTGTSEMEQAERVAAFCAGISVEPVRESRIVRIGYTSPWPDFARRAANAVAKAYIASAKQQRAENQSEVLAWLRRQLPERERELAEASRALEAFQRQVGLPAPDEERRLATEQLSRLQEELDGVNRKRVALESQLEEVRRASAAGGDVVAAVPGTLGLESDPALAVMLDRLNRIEQARLDSRRQEEQLRLAGCLEDHPDLLAARSLTRYHESERAAVIAQIVERLESRQRTVLSQAERLQAELDRQKAALDALNRQIVQLDLLRREVDRAREFCEPFRNKIEQLQVTSGFDPLPTRIIDAADLAPERVSPRMRLNVILGLVVGLLLGLGLAFGVEYVDDSVHSTEDLESYALLARAIAVPHIVLQASSLKPQAFRTLTPAGREPSAPAGPPSPGGRGGESGINENLKPFPALIAQLEPKSSAAEAFRSLRTSLLLVLRDSPPPHICLVGSSAPEEGKTTVLLNLAIVLAQGGRRVLAIDADLRRPSLHRLLGRPKEDGLSAALADGLEFAAVVQPTGIPNLSLLPAGKVRPNPAELLASSRMQDLLAWARREYDFVLLDSPPLAAVADAQILAPLVDGALLVVRAHRTERKLVRRGQALLAAAGVRLISGVLNNVEPASGRYYYPGYYSDYYYYHRYYGEEEAGHPTEPGPKPKA